MASPFDTWTYTEAKAAYDELLEEVGGEEAFTSNHAFVELHDHWQDGDGWVGPDGGSDPEARTKILAGVERQFTPRDAIGEILDRMANALLKSEADIELVPLEPVEEPEVPEGASEADRQRIQAEAEERAAVLEAEGAELRAQLAAWWDQRKLWTLMRRAVKRSRWASQATLRTWIAPGNLVEVGTGSETDEDESGGTATVLPSGLDFEEALAFVELSAPEPGVAFVHVDPDTQREVAVFLYEEDDLKKAELWYVDGDETHLRVVSDDDQVGDLYPFQLGARLPIVRLESELLVTDPVRRLQRRLNFFESIIVRVGETAGFPERYTVNAEPSGIWLRSRPADGPPIDTHEDENGVVWYLHAGQRTLGSAVTTELVGLLDEGQDGKKMRATPSVVFKEPTDPEYAAKAARHAYWTLLEQCRQGHLAMEDSGEASGIAYQQARADFEDDLAGLKPQAEALIRQILEVAIAWAELMGAEGESGAILDRFRVSVELHPRSGPITPDEQRQNNENVDAGTMSVESAMAANGVEDVDAELERIRSSPEARVELLTKQIESILEMSREGVPLDLAAQIMGVTDEEQITRFREAQARVSEGREQERALDDEIRDRVRVG